MNDTIKMIFSLIGSLAMFLYGMNKLYDGNYKS